MKNCIVKQLLIDQTTGQPIVFNTDNYQIDGANLSAADFITPEIAVAFVPRSRKPKEIQKARSKKKAEVYTPVWLTNEMIDALEKEWSATDLNEYIDTTFLDICCGEGVFLTHSYDPESGELISLESRSGVLDRKLSKIPPLSNQEVWFSWVKRAFQSVYGYEYVGDSLFLARKNLLDTFLDWNFYLYGDYPSMSQILELIEIITWNVIQMDGLNPQWERYRDWRNENKATD